MDEILGDIAHRKNKPIEDALGLERWYQDIREQGGRVIIERGDSVTIPGVCFHALFLRERAELEVAL